MMNNDTKDILKKLLQDSLLPHEKGLLATGTPVINHLQKQWNNAPDAATSDLANEQRIWKNIQRNLRHTNAGKKLLFYRLYAVAASCLLILGIGNAVLHTSEQAAPPVFIASSGIQNMQLVTLPDGSVVQMGPCSKLTYPAHFVGEKREVKLEGQAFFEVTKDKNKPFVVKSNEMEVTVLGTSFEVFNYEQENKIETILLTGKVKVNLLGKDKKNEVILSPNEKLTLSKNTQQVLIEKVDANKYSAWRNYGILSFENEKLSMIIPRLEKWYGRKITCTQDIADKYRFTFKVRDESLERILLMFSKSSPVGYTKVGENYMLCLIK